MKGKIKFTVSLPLTVGILIMLGGFFSLWAWNHFDAILDEKAWQEKLSSEDPHDKEDYAATKLTPESTTANKDELPDRTHFTYSPDKKRIAFIENTFREYGSDYNRHWSIQVFDIQTKTEKRPFVDDFKMSSYEWLDSNTIRAFHNAGTGTRAYRDIFVTSNETIFTKDYKNPPDRSFWTVDEDYSRQAQDFQLAEQQYYKLHRQ